MKISTRGRYGLRALADLSLQGEKPCPLSEIAQRQDLSLNYLESIFSALKRAGLVKSAAGAQGGYRLARPAGEISAKEVLDLLDGGVSMAGDEPNTTPLRAFLNRRVWLELDRCTEQVLENATVKSLAQCLEKKV